MSSRGRNAARGKHPPSRPPSRHPRAVRRLAQRPRWAWPSAIAAVLAIVAAVVGLHAANGPTRPAAAGAVAQLNPGQEAPDATFTTLARRTVSVSTLRGKPALLWFVSTWCSSCQAGTAAMARSLPALTTDGVRVEEVELYRDLGQAGPSMRTFAETLAGPVYGSPDWTFGTASAGLTRLYDPQSYLDIYYLLNAEGQIAYVNSSPGATMPQLLHAARGLA